MKLLAAMIIWIFAMPVFAIDADTIIENYKKEVTNNYATEVTSMKVDGMLISGDGQGSLDNRFKLYFNKPDMYRFERIVRGAIKQQVIRGDKAWMKYITPPVEMAFADSIELIRLVSLVDPMMLDIIKDNLDAEYTGEDKIDGRSVYVLEAKNLLNETNKYYFDKESFRLVRREEKTYAMNFPNSTEFNYKEYERIDGYLVPKLIEIVMNEGQSRFEFTSVEINYPLHSSVFRIPQ